jgi:hypothetical protein
VRVGVEGDADAGVPQELLDELRVDVPLEEEGGACMPEIVEGDLRQTRTLQERREATLSEVGGAYRGSGCGSEDEALILVDLRVPTAGFVAGWSY